MSGDSFSPNPLDPSEDPSGGDAFESQCRWMEHRCDLLSKELLVEGCADTVLILITVRDPKTQTTNCLSKATGNWYANVGAAREFIIKDQSRVNKYINDGEPQ